MLLNILIETVESTISIYLGATKRTTATNNDFLCLLYTKLRSATLTHDKFNPAFHRNDEYSEKGFEFLQAMKEILSPTDKLVLLHLLLEVFGMMQLPT